MLTTLILTGGALLFFGSIVYYALRQSKQKGIDEQVARDLKVVAEAESEIHQVQAEDRPTSKTKERLKKHDF